MTEGEPPREPPHDPPEPRRYKLSRRSLDELRGWIASTSDDRAEALWIALLALETMEPVAIRGYTPMALQDLEHPGHNIMLLDEQTLLIWKFADEADVIDVVYIGEADH